MWAAAGRHPEVVRLLLGRGADVNDRTRSSRHVVNRGSPTGTDADRPYVGDVEKGGSTALPSPSVPVTTFMHQWAP